MPSFDIEKSVTIDASREKAFSIVSDFKQWCHWSPWLIMEPEATVDVAPDGKSYSWKGSRVGEGSMTKTSANPPKSLDCDLLFLKPWKSQSKVRFELVQAGEGSKVTWYMEGSLPFFMAFMKKMMIAMIGMDFTRGLNMLKDYAETGTVPSRIEFTGETQYDGCAYVGISNECAIADIGPKMSADFERLMQWAKDAGLQPACYPLSLYHKWDMTHGTTRYTAAFPVTETPNDLPPGFMTGEVPSTAAYCLTHVGPYRHLGNAWSTGMNLGRSKVFKENKKIPPFEAYLNMPGEVDEKDLQTKIYFPTV